MKKQDNGETQHGKEPIGKPGIIAKYHNEKEDELPGSVVSNLTLALGSVVENSETEY